MYVNKEKVKTTKDAEGYADALRIIDEMKGDGWSYDGLCKNKDGSFTLFFSKDGKKSLTTPTIIDIDGAIAIPDGTYIGSLGKTTFENTYKDNKLVKRVVNGKEVDLQTWK
ncbi:MAG: hypothetical protein LBO06_08815 [Bacteroidales bacterium]|nr:hypothetical protein [Bacteroidales bacterium]